MPCPICAKASDPTYRPFCSRRCANIDLGRWLNESYVLPAPASDDEAPDPTEDTPPRRPQ